MQEQLDVGLAELEALRWEATGIPQEPGDKTSELADLRRQVQQKSATIGYRMEEDLCLQMELADPSSLMLGLDSVCRCLSVKSGASVGLLVDGQGRHGAACHHSGRLRTRASAPERTIAGVCREAGASVRFSWWT